MGSFLKGYWALQKEFGPSLIGGTVLFGLGECNYMIMSSWVGDMSVRPRGCCQQIPPRLMQGSAGFYVGSWSFLSSVLVLHMGFASFYLQYRFEASSLEPLQEVLLSSGFLCHTLRAGEGRFGL